MAVSTLIISGVTGYRNLCLLGWSYGLGLGGYRYALKMLALERIRPKYFTKAWGNQILLLPTYTFTIERNNNIVLLFSHLFTFALRLVETRT